MIRPGVYVRGIYRGDVKSVLSLFLMLFVFSTSTVSSAGSTVGMVTGVSGHSLKRIGQSVAHEIKRGDNVQLADTIETGTDSRVQILLTDGAVMVISPGSKARVSQYAYDVAANRRTAVINLVRGTVRLIMNDARASGSRIAIETEQATAVMSLADVAMSADAAKTVVASLLGGVSVRNRSNVIIGTVSVGENLFTTVTKKDPPTVPSLLSQQQRRTYTRDARFF